MVGVRVFNDAAGHTPMAAYQKFSAPVALLLIGYLSMNAFFVSNSVPTVTQCERSPSSFSTLFAGERALDAVLLLGSLALHHPGAHVYISTDSKTYAWFLDHTKVLFRRLELHWTLALDRYDMSLGREKMTAAGTYSDFLMEKVVILETALVKHNDTLFLDADIVVLEPIYLPDNVYQLGVSPHFFLKSSEGSQYGIYNAGMLWTNQYSLGQAWRDATAVSHYFEQVAIEDLIKKYTYFEFGPRHNMGYWRFDMGPNDIQRNVYVDAINQKIMLRNSTVTTIHSHILTPYPFASGTRFSDAIVELIGLSQNADNQRIMKLIQWAKGGCVPTQMVL